MQYDASPDERFEHRLSEPRPPGFHAMRNLWAPVSRVLRGPMMRLLDVGAALEMRERWGPSAPLRFGLEIEDAVVPENNGRFRVDFDGSRVSMARGDAHPLLSLPVAVLAQIFTGELHIGETVQAGLARSSDDMSAVDALFRVDRCFRLLDEF
ncbi:hypothetical protein BH23GEM9_BH23GEM9_05650 [soil metagenome]